MGDEYLDLQKVFQDKVFLGFSGDHAALNKDWLLNMVEQSSNISEMIDHAQTFVLPKFFALAEKIRKNAEGHYTPNQRTKGLPLLDPSITWAVPSSFLLPSVSLECPPLSSDEIKEAAFVN